ncbi:MAG: RrF2 family transcriptional regulator [Pseudomonadota bacterium]|uniref:RrF2 family transcriptional regulator n=1 Tax=Thermithiobacillus tepidarius TaxID=929 RepID=UPI0004196FF5|nr:Rrf2 family transcriptional regulator [Thermithiobacillus tepidarius]
MQLTRYTDYALRVLIYLGLQKDRPVTIQEIATSYGISKNHLMKVVHNLAKAGFILTSPGKGGGLRLGRAPALIRVGDVVRHTESDLSIVECLGSGKGDCPLNPACRLKGVLAEARDAFLCVLDRYTLEDLLGNGGRLAPLLGIHQPVTVQLSSAD